MSRIVASIEARMGASRLPGKVMKDLGGMPALELMAERVRKAQRLDDIVIATTTNPSDDIIVQWAKDAGLEYFRGSEDDVLSRVASAHRKLESEIVVELCGDCPLIDPAIIDQGIEQYIAGSHDLVTTARHPSFPQGVDVEVFSLQLLQKVEATVDDPDVREHVSLDFYQRPDLYRVADLVAPPELNRPEIRLLLDYPEDLEFLRLICARLFPEHGISFDIRTVLELIDREPVLSEINAAHTEFPVVS